MNCTERFINYDFTESATESARFTMGSTTVITPTMDYQQVFGIHLSFYGEWSFVRHTRIHATVIFKEDSACTGRMLQRNCTLRPAVVQYPIILRDGVATVDAWRLGQNETLEVKQLSDEDVPTRQSDGPFSGSMLGGINILLRNIYTSNVTWLFSPMWKNTLPHVSDVSTEGQSAINYINSDTSTYGSCNMTWGDPTADIVNTARELMFRSMVAYSEHNRSAVAPRPLRVRRTRSANTYKSHYKYLGITVACMALQAMVISYMLYGWHRLGRDVSLDTFEIARAMGAPVLQGGSSSSRIDVALSELRRDRFRYGERRPETKTPWAGADRNRKSDYETGSHELLEYATRSDSQVDDGGVGKKPPRLGLDRAERVGSIRQGVLY